MRDKLNWVQLLHFTEQPPLLHSAVKNGTECKLFSTNRFQSKNKPHCFQFLKTIFKRPMIYKENTLSSTASHSSIQSKSPSMHAKIQPYKTQIAKVCSYFTRCIEYKFYCLTSSKNTVHQHYANRPVKCHKIKVSSLPSQQAKILTTLKHLLSYNPSIAIVLCNCE